MNSVDGDLILKDGQKVYISVGEDSTEMYYYTNPGNPATLIQTESRDPAGASVLAY